MTVNNECGHMVVLNGGMFTPCILKENHEGNHIGKSFWEGRKDRTPLRAIREWCMECSQQSWKEVKNCQHDDCQLHPFRMKKSVKGLSPLKTIRKYCLWCVVGNHKEVELCHLQHNCPLHPYRFGKRPDTRRRQIEKRPTT